MKKKEVILNEIQNLLEISYEIRLKRVNQNDAEDITYIISKFSNTFSEKYIYAIEHYRKNNKNEIEISDGLELIKQYIQKKAIKKYDHDFRKGQEKILNGINQIINELKNDLAHHSD